MLLNEEMTTTNHPWYAIRTFNCQEQKVCRFLAEKGFLHFIPMKVTQTPVKEGESPKQVLTPAVHNLLFVQQPENSSLLIQALKDCPFPVSVFRHPGVDQYCVIPDSEMVELRMLCDPQFHTPIYLASEEADVMVGKEVRIMKGPFKGSIGKLVRKQKQYYFLKVVTGMGVMVHISRWYCKPLH